MKDGVVGEMTLNTKRAADGRHPAFITTFTLPAKHAAWAEGTLMSRGAASGTAKADVTSDGSGIIGVLDEAVEADEGTGNVIIHGSCPGDILKWDDGSVIVAANEEQIEALRGIGIYV